MSQSVSVSKDGRWPFYAAYAAPPVGNGGRCLGGSPSVTSPLRPWVGPCIGSARRGAFRRRAKAVSPNTATLVGSAFKAAEKPLLPLDRRRSGHARGRQLALQHHQPGHADVQNSGIVLTGAPENRDKLALTINKTSGAVTGSFANPSNPKQSIKISGVLLQNQGMAAGYFLNDNQSGAFLLENP